MRPFSTSCSSQSVPMDSGMGASATPSTQATPSTAQTSTTHRRRMARPGCRPTSGDTAMSASPSAAGSSFLSDTFQGKMTASSPPHRGREGASVRGGRHQGSARPSSQGRPVSLRTVKQHSTSPSTTSPRRRYSGLQSMRQTSSPMQARSASSPLVTSMNSDSSTDMAPAGRAYQPSRPPCATHQPSSSGDMMHR